MNWKKNLKTCTILTGLTVASMHIVNRFVYYMSTIDEMLSDKNAEYYDWRFGRICYHKTGSGSPLLLIHGLNVCSSSYEWNQIVDQLSKTNRKNGCKGAEKVSKKVKIEFQNGDIKIYNSKSEFNREHGEIINAIIRKTKDGNSHRGFKGWEI